MNVIDITFFLIEKLKLEDKMASRKVNFLYSASSLSNLLSAGVLKNKGPAGSKPIYTFELL